MDDIRIISDTGSGRAFTFLIEKGSGIQELLHEILSSYGSDSRKITIEIPTISDTNWKGISDDLLKKFTEMKIRQTSLVGFGVSGAIAQNLVLREPKSIRALVLIDSSLQPGAGLWQKFLEKIEAHLPFGLPLRKNSPGFDSKPYLQRLRCPVMVLTTAAADENVRFSARTLISRVPSAWHAEIPVQNVASEIAARINECESIPAKCPQKNR